MICGGGGFSVGWIVVPWRVLSRRMRVDRISQGLRGARPLGLPEPAACMDDPSTGAMCIGHCISVRRDSRGRQVWSDRGVNARRTTWDSWRVGRDAFVFAGAGCDAAQRRSRTGHLKCTLFFFNCHNCD
jgi:hypothetical protein